MKNIIRYYSLIGKSCKALLGVAAVIALSSPAVQAYPAGTKIVNTYLYGSFATGNCPNGTVKFTCSDDVLYVNGVASAYKIIQTASYTVNDGYGAEEWVEADGNQVEIRIQTITLPNSAPGNDLTVISFDSGFEMTGINIPIHG